MEITDALTRAAAARSQRRYAEAIQIYEGLLHVDLDPDIMWALAETEFALSVAAPDPEDTHGLEAIRRMEAAIGLRSDCADYFYALGDMLEHVMAPAYEAAADAYRRAVEIEPCHVPALSGLAMLYGVPEGVVSLKEALSCCQRATRIHPTRSLWLTLARLYEADRRPQDSLAARKKSLLEMRESPQIQY